MVPHWSKDLLRTLVRFTYEFIGNRRKQALVDMQDLCEVGIVENEQSPLADQIALYFNSKFHEEMLGEKMTAGGRSFDVKLIEHYMDKAAGVMNELEHVFGSVRRILGDNPDNGGLLLLRAYAILLIESKVVNGKLVARSEPRVHQAEEVLSEGLFHYERRALTRWTSSEIQGHTIAQRSFERAIGPSKQRGSSCDGIQEFDQEP
ncbi:MAG: hypothetical protein IPI07_07485 [Flavobacteriales bacterium]|nr:hypothetical protein [Flavobacteriales bacterium]